MKHAVCARVYAREQSAHTPVNAALEKWQLNPQRLRHVKYVPSFGVFRHLRYLQYLTTMQVSNIDALQIRQR